MWFVRFAGLVLSIGFVFHGSVQATDSVGSVLSQVPKACERHKKRVIASLKKFQQIEAKVNVQLAKELEKQHAILLRTRGRIGAARELDQIQALYKWIGTGNQLPHCDLLTDIVLKYTGQLEKPRLVVVERARILRTQLIKQKQNELADDLVDALADVGGILDARNLISPRVVLRGFRIAYGKTEGPKLKLRITHSEGNRFSGVIDRDPGIYNHPVHEIKGEIEGTRFVADIGPSVSGGSKSDGKVRYDGIVVGSTILGRFSRINPKGKRVQGSFRFDLKGP